MRALRAVLKPKRTRAQPKAGFSVIRAHDDRALLGAFARADQGPARARDPLVRELEQTLKPIIAPAQEKADMLVEHLGKKHRKKLAFTPKGLADAVRRLRARFSDDEIRAGAKSLMTRLAKLYGEPESVV